MNCMRVEKCMLVKKENNMNVKTGLIKKCDTELLLCAGSKIITTNENGDIVEYVLGSDIFATIENDARLFEAA